MTDTDRLVESLFSHALPRLGAYAYALTGSYAAAEELVQDAMVKVFSRRRALDGPESAEAYVRVTMRTLHLDGLRRGRLWERAVPRLARADVVPDHAGDAEARDDVARALATLPPRVRTAVALHYLDDLAIATVADLMRLSEGTVKGYLKEGRARLSAVLHDDSAAGEVVRVKEVRR